jgi:hypothetical protein
VLIHSRRSFRQKAKMAEEASDRRAETVEELERHK